MEQFTVQLNNATCTVCIGAGVLGRAGAAAAARAAGAPLGAGGG